MFKYKKIVIFLVVSVLLLGSAILYTVFSGMDSENTVYNIQQKTNYQKEKEVDENSDYDTVSTDNVNEQIDGIVSGYLNAKLDDNISGMKKYVNDITVIDEKKIQAQNQSIESYNNIKCTVKKCYSADAYRVYVYCDIKAFGVESMLPSLSAYYIKRAADGKYEIYFGKINSNEQKEILKFDKSDEITALKDSVQKRMNDLISTDEEVRTLFDELKSGE